VVEEEEEEAMVVEEPVVQPASGHLSRIFLSHLSLSHSLPLLCPAHAYLSHARPSHASSSHACFS
jgi:hypothetical protein